MKKLSIVVLVAAFILCGVSWNSLGDDPASPEVVDPATTVGGDVVQFNRPAPTRKLLGLWERPSPTYICTAIIQAGPSYTAHDLYITSQQAGGEAICDLLELAHDSIGVPGTQWFVEVMYLPETVGLLKATRITRFVVGRIN